MGFVNSLVSEDTVYRIVLLRSERSLQKNKQRSNEYINNVAQLVNASRSLKIEERKKLVRPLRVHKAS